MRLLDLPGDVLFEITSQLIDEPRPFTLNRTSKPFERWEMPDLSHLHRSSQTCTILRDTTLSLRFRYVQCSSWDAMHNIVDYLDSRPELGGMIRYLSLNRPGFLETSTRSLIFRLLRQLTSLEVLQAAFRGYLDTDSLSSLSVSPRLRHVWLDCDMIQTDPVPAFADMRLTSLHLGILKLHRSCNRAVAPLHDILLGKSRYTLRNLELLCFSGGGIGTGELLLSKLLPEAALLSLPALEILSLLNKIRIDGNLLAHISRGFPRLKVLNSGTSVANAIDYFACGHWDALERLNLAHFMSLGTSEDIIAHEQVLMNARALTELRICNVPVPGAFRVLGRDIRSMPLRNLRDVTLHLQLFVPEVMIGSEDFSALFEGIPSVRKLVLLSASYGTPQARKKWSTDLESFAASLGRLQEIEELEFDPQLIHENAYPLPRSDLLSTPALKWKNRQVDIYKSYIMELGRQCPSLRSVKWLLAFPSPYWRCVILRPEASTEQEYPVVEMYLERIDWNNNVS